MTGLHTRTQKSKVYEFRVMIWLEFLSFFTGKKHNEANQNPDKSTRFIKWGGGVGFYWSHNKYFQGQEVRTGFCCSNV